jgi:hypothetical protein
MSAGMTTYAKHKSGKVPVVPITIKLQLAFSEIASQFES